MSARTSGSAHEPVRETGMTDHRGDPLDPEPPVEPQHAHVPGPTSYDKKQQDVGASLFLGGVVIIVLLVVLIWQGLF